MTTLAGKNRVNRHNSFQLAATIVGKIALR